MHTRMNVILAEDDLDIQLVARLALKRAGFIVKVVGNGQEALDAVKAEPPDVILLDWMMPELDGPETCRRLKSDPATAVDPGHLSHRKIAGSRDPARPQPRRRRLRDQAVRRAHARPAREGHRQQVHSVKIRTRAFVVLWLITILVAGTIGFILVAAEHRVGHGRRAPAHLGSPERARLAVAGARRAQARSA